MSDHQQDTVATRTWAEWAVWVATEDHCEWANRFVYWIKTPLGVLGMAGVASLACGLWVAPQGYALLAAILAVVAIGLVWPWVGIRGLRCELGFVSPRGREGRPTGVDVTITNRWPWPVWGLAIEEGFFVDGSESVGEGETAVVALARIGGWSRSTFRWEFPPEQRGLYPHVSPRLVTEFPFGLYRARRAIDVAERLVVWPEAFWLPPLPAPRGAHDWTGPVSDAHAGHEGERTGVRDHRPGDSLRMVHWAKSACVDRLIVCEREANSWGKVRVEVDADPNSHAGEGAASSLEWAIRIAASVCETLLGQGLMVELRVGEHTRSAAPGRHGAACLMDLLALFDTDERIEAGAGPAGAATTTLGIGAELSELPRSRSILLDTAGFAPGSGRANDDVPCWIRVESADDVPGQVLRGWREASREASHAT